MKIIALNWKLNPETEKEALSLLGFSDRKGVLVFPPSIFLAEIARKAKRAEVGAQNIFWEEGGAFTGEISPSMVKDAGVQWVLIGHSERRRYFDETDEMINKKILAALHADLRVILCVGEPLEVRKKGVSSAKKFVAYQLENDLRGIKNFKLKIKNLVVAYEPIWAIGTGKADKPAESAEMAKFIKETLSSKPYPPNPKVLYGGSVNAKNIAAFLRPGEIDGVLIGGASLKREELKRIFGILKI